MAQRFLLIDADEDFAVLRAASSEVRVRILRLLHRRGGLNVNEISTQLDLPQSSISSNIQILEAAGLVRTESVRAKKGSQKICHAVYDELIISYHKASERLESNTVEVSMPLGLYTNCSVSGPCGICSPEGIIGLLDVPDTFMDPERMKAALLWFTSGFVEYQFPNNAKIRAVEVGKLEFSMEVSSEVPGTRADWPSDVSVSINGVELGTWTSPGDFGDRRGVYTPDWWKLSGSQYGMLKSWTVNGKGSFVDGQRISSVTVADLGLDTHRSVRVRIEVKAEARHPGGINVFGRGFGNYDQDIVLRLSARD